MTMFRRDKSNVRSSRKTEVQRRHHCLITVSHIMGVNSLIPSQILQDFYLEHATLEANKCYFKSCFYLIGDVQATSE